MLLESTLKNGRSIMGKTIVKTFEEIDKEWTPEKLRELAKKLESFPDDDPDPITDEDLATGRVRPIGPGEGFDAFMESVNRKKHLKADAKKELQPA